MKLFGWEIIIRKKPHTRKLAEKGRRRWTTSEINTMMKLLEEGKTAKEIGTLLKRTEKAILTKAANVRKRNSKKNDQSP